MKIKILPILFALTCTLGANSLEVSVTPGSLASLIATPQVSEAQSLTLTGCLDARDFQALAGELPALQTLDLSGVSIEAYHTNRAVGSQRTSFPADELPAGALLGCKASNIILPATIKTIGQGAMAGSAILTIEIPASVDSIASEAFYGCPALKRVSLPSSVKRMGENVFASCPSLKQADLSAFSPAILPAGTFRACTALEQVSLPASLTAIGTEAFAGDTALVSISLPESLRAIGNHAFSLSGLQSITFPAGLQQTGSYALSGCHHLAKVEFSSFPSLGEGLCFADPELRTISFTASSLPADYSYPDYLFAGSPNVALPADLLQVSQIGRYALKDNASTAVTLGENLTYLADGAMEGMANLKSIDASALHQSVPTLGEDVFAGIPQGNVTLHTANGEDNSAWKNADQWREFNIQAIASISSPGAPSPDLKAWIDGGILHISSSSEIDLVQIFLPSGASIYEGTSGLTNVEIPLPSADEPVYIVRVSQPGSASVFKLTR